MGLFSSRNKELVIQPIKTAFDEAWFDDYIDTVVADSGVDRTDVLNYSSLSRKVLAALAITGKSAMTQTGAPWAWTQFEKYLANATPWDAVSFIAGWDQRALPFVESELHKFQGMLIQTGRATGSFRHDW